MKEINAMKDDMMEGKRGALWEITDKIEHFCQNSF